VNVEEASAEFIDVQAGPIQFSLQLGPELLAAPEEAVASDDDVLVIDPRTSIVPMGASLTFGVGRPVYVGLT
jgi:hypothetical protein